MADVNVKGLSELQAYLDQVPAKIEQNIMRQALRAGMKVIQPAAQANIRPISGLLAAGLKIKTGSRNGTVRARLVATGPHAFIAPFLEFGTKAHRITAKGGKSLFFGGLFAKSVQHPGIKKGTKAFMRPALDGRAQAAVIAAAEYVKQRLATKNGLDTAGVKIEGDE